ncbi:tRNA 2-thiouridine(34) synthase MnmA [Candidatus Pacearchaeota archaeon]|nr:tRNA 2-thiouridine(34) synthase MnmA [Candidatus Pacearchaeota archaeon]
MEYKTKNKPTVLLGLSGGVDSSVAAHLLKRQGFRVIGVFLKLYSDTKNPLTGECSYLDDLKIAKKIALILGIRLIELDYEEEYKSQVLEHMFSDYKKGLTPNPDIDCNRIIKFPYLWKEAKKFGAEYIATGHYARIMKSRGEFQLLTGKDKSKDQSYFLAELSELDLKHIMFPIGNLTKKEVRKIAKKEGFPNWNKHGTVGICFVGQIPMQKFLQKKIKPKKGNVIDSDGKILGTHEGTAFYTIGQKVGSHIGIDIIKPRNLAQKRFYVAEKKKGNILVVAPERHHLLFKKDIIIKDLHLINSKKDLFSNNLKARIRHLGFFYKGRITKNHNEWHFLFQKPIEAVAEGQYVVLYNRERVVGCGEIRLK